MIGSSRQAREILYAGFGGRFHDQRSYSENVPQSSIVTNSLNVKIPKPKEPKRHENKPGSEQHSRFHRARSNCFLSVTTAAEGGIICFDARQEISARLLRARLKKPINGDL